MLFDMQEQAPVLQKEKPMDAHIQVKNLTVYYGKQQALKNINIEIPKNQITVNMGPSGCG